jgi:hypothetical protein
VIHCAPDRQDQTPSTYQQVIRGARKYSALLFISGIASACVAQERSCAVPTVRYAILVPEAAAPTPEEGEAFMVTPAEVDLVECTLIEFIRWHQGLTQQVRDSLMDASEGHVRSACMSREWSTDHRQYRGNLQQGKRIVLVNSFCSAPEIGHTTVDLTRLWYEVDDGGDCYFQASVDMTTGQVIRFSVNGPYDVMKCR